MRTVPPRVAHYAARTGNIHGILPVAIPIPSCPHRIPSPIFARSARERLTSTTSRTTRSFNFTLVRKRSTPPSLNPVMSLATCADGPSVRIVLKNTMDAASSSSNYESRKGRELAINPQAGLLFH